MFRPECWNALQTALNKYADDKSIRYVLKIDVANFFGSLNQHTLVNVLSDAGYPKPFVDRLEVLLTAFTGDRSSRGILQGIYPSDLFGNFYMEPIDRLFSDMDIPSARYVDDMFIFVKSVDEADHIMRALIPELRRYDLSLNEAKSLLIPKNLLHTEEPDLEALFQGAIDEIASQLDDSDFETEYGFQSEWEDEPEDAEFNGESFLELEATKLLFDSTNDYPGHEENIERFCLPLFAKAKSDYAVFQTMDSFRKRPSMAQIYCVYLSKFMNEKNVLDFFELVLGESNLYDWQLMWVLAALLQRKPEGDDTIKKALKILKDGGKHEAVRAVAGIYVGRHGDATRRNALRGEYVKVSPYVQSAIYYSSMYWPGAEKANAKATWGNQGFLNQLIMQGMSATK